MSTDLRFQAPAVPAIPERARRELPGRRAENLRAAAAGQARWGHRPFGYARDSAGVHTVPKEAEAIQRAVAALLAGETLGAVARGLNDAGFETTMGGAWTATGLRRTLLNPRMAGEQVYRGQVLCAGDWPPILTTAQQGRLRALLSSPARRTQQSTAVRHLLSGIARCGHEGCGGPLWSMGKKGDYICRDGGGHLTRKSEPVDAYVSSVVPVMLARAQKRLPAPEILQPELDELNRRRDELAGLVAEGMLTGRSARARAAELTAKIHDAELRLATPKPRRFFGRVSEAQDWWDNLDLAGQREMLQAHLDIVIKPLGRGVKATPEQYVEIKLKPLT